MRSAAGTTARQHDCRLAPSSTEPPGTTCIQLESDSQPRPSWRSYRPTVAAARLKPDPLDCQCGFRSAQIRGPILAYSTSPNGAAEQCRVWNRYLKVAMTGDIRTPPARWRARRRRSGISSRAVDVTLIQKRRPDKDEPALANSAQEPGPDPDRRALRNVREARSSQKLIFRAWAPAMNAAESL